MNKHSLWHFLWILPFICFIAGYFLVASLYTIEELSPPNIVGKNVHEALGIISQYNLNARLLTYKDDILLPEGTVLSQTPTAAQKMRPNQTIYLVISTRPALKKAPNLLNTKSEETIQTLIAAGIKPKTYSLPSNYPINTCFAQFPAPGQPIENGKIALYISAGTQKPVLMPNLKGQKITTILEFLTPYNVKPEISHKTGQPDTHECTECIVTDQRPLSGTIITLNPEKPLIIQLMAGASE